MRRIVLSAILLIATSTPEGAFGQPSIISEIAPMGRLRVAMNAQTPVLLRKAPDGKIIGGVGLEVGKFIAEKLGVPFELVPYPDSNTYTQSFGKGEWDIGFAVRANGERLSNPNQRCAQLLSQSDGEAPYGRNGPQDSARRAFRSKLKANHRVEKDPKKGLSPQSLASTTDERINLKI